jgi:hypothetical protein
VREEAAVDGVKVPVRRCPFACAGSGMLASYTRKGMGVWGDVPGRY